MSEFTERKAEFIAILEEQGEKTKQLVQKWIDDGACEEEITAILLTAQKEYTD